MDRLVSRKMNGVSIGYCECRRIIAFDFLFITSFNCLLEQLVGRDACQREIQDFEDKTKTFGKLSGQSAGSAFLTSKLRHHGPDRTALKKLCLDHRLACVVLPRGDLSSKGGRAPQVVAVVIRPKVRNNALIYKVVFTRVGAFLIWWIRVRVWALDRQPTF